GDSSGHLWLSVLDLTEETGSLAAVADVAIAEACDPKQHGVLVAVLQDAPHLQAVSRRFPLGPQFSAASAEERGEAGGARDGQRFFVHEANHQHFAAAVVLNDCRYQSIEFAKVHLKSWKTKKPRRLS